MGVCLFFYYSFLHIAKSTQINRTCSGRKKKENGIWTPATEIAPQISVSANHYTTTLPEQNFTFISLLTTNWTLNSSHICGKKTTKMFPQISGPMPFLCQGYHYANNHIQWSSLAKFCKTISSNYKRGLGWRVWMIDSSFKAAVCLVVLCVSPEASSRSLGY